MCIGFWGLLKELKLLDMGIINILWAFDKKLGRSISLFSINNLKHSRYSMTLRLIEALLSIIDKIMPSILMERLSFNSLTLLSLKYRLSSGYYSGSPLLAELWSQRPILFQGNRLILITSGKEKWPVWSKSLVWSKIMINLCLCLPLCSISMIPIS